MLEPKTFASIAGVEALSANTMAQHHKLYRGYVEKYNELAEKLLTLHARGRLALDPDTESLKVDVTFALGAVKNHELYFDILGGEAHEPTGELKAAIESSFHSVTRFMIDLKQTAIMARSWAWTAYDHTEKKLFNFQGDTHNGLPVWGATPIIAVDLYGHAYYYDFGNNKVAYIDTILANLNWARIAERFAAARAQ